VTRPRAADDFATIRARMEEPRRERAQMSAARDARPLCPRPYGRRHAAAKHQQCGRGLALLLHSDARPAGPRPAAHGRARATPGCRPCFGLEEATLLLQAAPGPKYKPALATAYGVGLRVSAVVALKVDDIGSERMPLRVEQGKGRNAMLSRQLLELLRDWWWAGSFVIPRARACGARTLLQPSEVAASSRPAPPKAGSGSRLTLSIARAN
jgi:hypothetical protein